MGAVCRKPGREPAPNAGLDDATDQPFGTLEDRLDARDAMQQAASGLFAVLDTAQQQTAMQLLPLCCLPNATAMALAEARA